MGSLADDQKKFYEINLTGKQKIVVTTDPAANVEISSTVPAGKVWELISARFTLVTDANVANRRVRLVFDDGTTTFLEIAAFADQAASLTRNYNFSQDSDVPATQPIASDFYNHLPGRLVLPAGYRIQTATTNRQAGDNFGAARLVVREYDA
jgi:hypothetical protein